MQKKFFNDGPINVMRIRPVNDTMHNHIFFELVYVTNGTATHNLEDKTIQLRTGDYFIIDIGTVHCYQNVDNFEIVNCLFMPEHINRAMADCPSLTLLLSNQVLRFDVPVNIHAADKVFHDSDRSILRAIQAMEKEFATQDIGYMEELRCYLSHVLIALARTSQKAEQALVPHKATTAILEYLHAHLAEQLSLELLSQQVGYTAQYISRLFRKDTGMTLQEYLQKLRIEEACRLMSRRGLSIADIALTVGYSDTKHFSKVFRRHKGISAKEFRSSIL